MKTITKEYTVYDLEDLKQDDKNISLYDWFCMPCCNKAGNEIEEQD